MTEVPIREPDQNRQDCARKLRSVETSGMFAAILGALLGEDWSMPKIEELRITSDHCLLARPAGEVSFKVFFGGEADWVRSIHGLSAVVEFDGDEVGDVYASKLSDPAHTAAFDQLANSVLRFADFRTKAVCAASWAAE